MFDVTLRSWYRERKKTTLKEKVVNVIEEVPGDGEMNNGSDSLEIVNNDTEDVVIKRIYSLMCWRAAGLLHRQKVMWIKWSNNVKDGGWKSGNLV